MTENYDNLWHNLSDNILTEKIGAFVKHHRLQKNISQTILAKRANISRSTLSILEHGGTTSVATLLQVLRILDQLHVMDSFTIHDTISPIAMVQEEAKKRTRVSKKYF
jgi:transcriptional regulator with XRE-family HTH domain